MEEKYCIRCSFPIDPDLEGDLCEVCICTTEGNDYYDEEDIYDYYDEEEGLTQEEEEIAQFFRNFEQRNLSTTQ